jgi:hypothetical protein
VAIKKAIIIAGTITFQAIIFITLSGEDEWRIVTRPIVSSIFGKSPVDGAAPPVDDLFIFDL